MGTADESKPVVVEADVCKVATEEKAEGGEEETTTKTEDKTAAVVEETADEKKGDEVQEESSSVLGVRKSVEPTADGEAPEKGEEGKTKAVEGDEPPTKTAKTTEAEEAPVAEPVEA